MRKDKRKYRKYANRCDVCKHFEYGFCKYYKTTVGIDNVACYEHFKLDTEYLKRLNKGVNCRHTEGKNAESNTRNT